MATSSTLVGMSYTTGTTITGVAHVRQSIAIVLFTPIGSLPMRRDFGSLLPELIDHPDNPVTRLRIYAAAAIALMRWVPNFRLSTASIESGDTPGAAQLVLDGTYIDPAGTQSALQLAYPIAAKASA